MPKETTLNPDPAPTVKTTVAAENMDSQGLARMIRDRRLAQAPSAPAIEPKPQASESEPVKMAGSPPSTETATEDQLETATDAVMTEQAQPETPATDEEMEEMIGNLPADQSKAIRAMYERINKVTKNWRQEQQQREQLEARIKQLTADPKETEPVPQPASAIPEVPSGSDPVLSEIDAKLAKINKVLTWARDNPDGGTINPGPGKAPFELDADQVAQLQQETWSEITALKSRRAVREDTVRERLNNERNSAYQSALKTYPWLTDQNHPLFLEAVAYVNANPGLKALPNFHQVVGDIISAKSARAKKPTGKTPLSKSAAEPTPVVAGGAGGGGTQTDAEAELQAAEERFAREGSAKAQQALIRARRRYREAA